MLFEFSEGKKGVAKVWVVGGLDNEIDSWDIVKENDRHDVGVAPRGERRVLDTREGVG